MRHGTRQLSGKRARHGAGHRRVAGFYSAAWPDIAPPLTNPARHDPALYRQRHRIENLFARIKDWRRIATRYDRCGDLFLAAIIIAATVTFWL